MSGGAQNAGPMVAGDAWLYPAPGPRGPKGEQGPKGDTGQPGDASSIPVMWTGQGAPPTFIPGAKSGDTWMDTITGDIYTLDI